MKRFGSVKNVKQEYERLMIGSNLYKYYSEEIKTKLQSELKIKNSMATPRLLKIVVNVGLGEALINKNAIENMSRQLMVITGQKPVITYAKRDISTFKLRKGDAIGLKITLRGIRMYDFYEKLVKIVLPRIRDFRGINSSSIDEKGNFTLGLKEQIVFPEIEYGQIDKVRGLEITIMTNARNKEQALKLMEMLGMPFKKT